MKHPLNKRTRHDALLEGARVLVAMASVYSRKTRSGPVWARRAQEARRYARVLRELA